MAEHISFPSINQFKDVIKHIHSGCHYHQIPVPTVTFRGTVKLHGTNAGICRPVNGGVNDIYYQSRERVITPEQDNAGFAMWAYGNREVFNDLFDHIRSWCATVEDDDIIQIFGEWAGGNIQKGVGLNQIEKSFFVFGIRVSKNGESNVWQHHSVQTYAIDTIVDARIPNMYDINDFPHWEIDIDMTDAKAVQNKLIELTMAVEEDCPVVRTLRGDQTVTPSIGEGIVWQAVIPNTVDTRIINMLSGLRFKVKGEKHSASKVKTIAPVDTEKLNSIKEFVEYAVTENRLNQGLDKLREKGLPQDSTSTGEFIKWIMGDVLKEELDVVAKSGLTTKEITGPIANKARDFFMKQL